LNYTGIIFKIITHFLLKFKKTKSVPVFDRLVRLRQYVFIVSSQKGASNGTDTVAYARSHNTGW